MELPDGPPTEMTPRQLARQGFALSGEQARALWEELDRIKGERDLFRARLVDVMPWVGCVPYPNTPRFTEMILVRDLAQDALDEVKR
jgi:hypothetical protein